VIIWQWLSQIIILYSKFVLDQYNISARTYNQEIFSSIVLCSTTSGKETKESVGGREAGDVAAFCNTCRISWFLDGDTNSIAVWDCWQQIEEHKNHARFEASNMREMKLHLLEH
jgi:hypothetical protein